jgi:serine/threonine-protein kinase SRPK3
MSKLDSSLFEEENLQDYCKGGYYPVVLGETLDKKYRVISKLGYGHYSTVWFAMNISPKAKHKYVALKIVKSDINYTNAANTELKHLSKSFFFFF